MGSSSLTRDQTWVPGPPEKSRLSRTDLFPVNVKSSSDSLISCSENLTYFLDQPLVKALALTLISHAGQELHVGSLLSTLQLLCGVCLL